ncbi:MAG: hypothetical protein OXI81_10105 [Paracoccaceae bacterium]|nr:hypothetical protein [Paracoccaceae bacterium]
MDIGRARPMDGPGRCPCRKNVVKGDAVDSCGGGIDEQTIDHFGEQAESAPWRRPEPAEQHPAHYPHDGATVFTAYAFADGLINAP